MSVRCTRGHVTDADPCTECGAPAETTSTIHATGDHMSSQCPQCGMASDPSATFCEACGTPLSNRPNAPRAESVAETGSVKSARSRPATTSTPTYRHQMTAPTAPSPPTAEPWLIERTIDLGWHASQHATGTPPAPSDPQLVTARSATLLVGRQVGTSATPDIECGQDTAVSRGHCRLTTDGRRWWVEDLGSSNGTYLRRRNSPLPTHRLPEGRQHELLDGDRLYLGAWTRIVVRRALPGEF